ncbi:hypothetical protein Acsp03_58830 [Actinomadura sp. NBRC 104412]|nr:hypothetical protein Acsp03_58830 [Actinomadura sp. NBRC 104412]
MGALGVRQGRFHWHRHDEQDKCFFVLDGRFHIELEHADAVELGPPLARHSPSPQGWCTAPSFPSAAP